MYTYNLQTKKREGNSQKRICGLDSLRALAIICVIGGHYFLNTDYDATPLNNPLLFILGTLYSFTQIGVPIFMMLTGYLNLNKIESDKKYFKGIWKVLIAYVFFSVVTILFRKYYLGHEKSMFQWMHSILSFDAIPYSWYIEMWIGLFLLTPFLNKLWHAIENKSQRQILLVILFICTSLPDFTNRYGLHLLPDYWRGAAYPLLTFYLGAYIRTYQPSFNSIKLIGIIVGLCLINPVTSMILAYGKPMFHPAGSPSGIVVIPIAVCTFLLFYRTDIKAKPVKSMITKISLLSLDMYLVAYLFDQWFYPIWKRYLGPTQSDLAPFYILIILSLVIGTFLTAWTKQIIFDTFKGIASLRHTPTTA